MKKEYNQNGNHQQYSTHTGRKYNIVFIMKITQLVHLNSALKNRLEHYSQQNTLLNNRVMELTIIVKKLEDQLRNSTFTAVELQSNVKQYKQKNDKLQRQVHELKSNIEKQINLYSAEQEEMRLKLTNMQHEYNIKLSQYQEEINQLVQLIKRQEKILAQQNNQCQRLTQQNNQQIQTIEKLSEDLNSLEECKKRKQSYLWEMTDKFEELTTKVMRKNSDWNILMEIEKIRLSLRELQQSEIDKIQDIITNQK